MQVLKFGGTSVANANNIRKIKNIVQSKYSGGRTVIVVSAFAGITDMLLQCGSMAADGNKIYTHLLEKLTTQHIDAVRELLPVSQQNNLQIFVMEQLKEVENICNGINLLNEFSPKTKDRLVSYGELISSRIVSAYFSSEGLSNYWIDARCIIKTNSDFTYAAVDFQTSEKLINEFFKAHTDSLYIVQGYIASDEAGNTTTLGRGGSDYTAAILGEALNATNVEIWTDVSGMMTADPRLVSNAKSIKTISYHEAMELSHFGAKVIYTPTLQRLMKKNIPVLIKNTFSPEHNGTLIISDVDHNGSLIRGISSISQVALLSIEGSGIFSINGFAKRLFEALAVHDIHVIFITQASSEHSICVGVEQMFASKAKKIIDKAFASEIETQKVHPLVIEKDLAILALVGDQMKSHPGISGRMFGILGRNGVNVRAIAQGSSERNISAVVNSKDITKAVNSLHEEFFEPSYKQLNVFIVGTGNVGSKLIAQIAQQQKYIQQNLLLQIRVVALGNSRKMVFNDKGINLKNWRETLDNGNAMDLGDFLNLMQQKNLRNSVFVDITASDKVAAVYEQIFIKNISIVACNKIACSSPYNYYNKLKESARDNNASFFFETNVGASLPIIATLNDFLNSGDSITKIEAVLSGTLNFVFNNYDGRTSFAEVVRQAQKEGYTEPDPRLDLSGKDVMRKIMILARESGAKLEMEDITNESFMPPSCMTGSVEDFYREMENEEAHFKKLYEEAVSGNNKLKFVASYENGKASVGLKHIAPEHDFYHLYGKDNIVLFYTNRYNDQPMVVKGAGAGAEVTASGVFADIIRTART
jgi:bifunctional aspartokinase / homoserine dehydrogenase 1